MGVGLLLISIATPLVSQTIADKWFTWPNLLMMSPIPIFTAACFGIMLWLLKNPARVEQGQGWILYAATVAVCLLVSLGLGYSLYPDIIIGQMTIWEASASVKSLLFTLFGVALTLPAIIVYTIVIYRIFHGKAADLSYD
jgi:cytochrome d ubiquinol oxidase subunit II